MDVYVLFDYSDNKPKNGGICVANHTTPIDVIILANDGCYSMVEHSLFLSVLLFFRIMNECDAHAFIKNE